MQGQSRATAHRSDRGKGAAGLRLLINPPRLRLDDRTIIFKFTGNGGWFCASFGAGAKYMRAIDEDAALRRGIDARAKALLRHRCVLDPDLARVMAAVELAKDYDPDEPRDDDGRWTSGGVAGAAAGAIADAARMFGNSAYAEGLRALAARALAALPAVAGSVAGVAAPAAAFFGTLFFPTPQNLVASDGTLPDAPDYSYHFDQEAGHLTIMHQLDDGTSETVFDGRYDKDGVFRDDQGNAIGRFLGDSVALDADAVRGYEVRQRSDAQASPGAIAQADTATRSDPEVCPEPGPDKPGGQSDPRAIAYQMVVGIAVNGAALPQGMAIKMIGPDGKPVYFDDCRLSNGALVEAKGYSYGDAMRSGYAYPWFGMLDRMLKQSSDQLEAAQGRPIEWHFADKDVADYMQGIFGKMRPGIQVIWTPAPEWLDKILRGDDI